MTWSFGCHSLQCPLCHFLESISFCPHFCVKFFIRYLRSSSYSITFLLHFLSNAGIFLLEFLVSIDTYSRMLNMPVFNTDLVRRLIDLLFCLALWIEIIFLAIKVICHSASQLCKPFDIFHLSSFYCNLYNHMCICTCTRGSVVRTFVSRSWHCLVIYFWDKWPSSAGKQACVL